MCGVSGSYIIRGYWLDHGIYLCETHYAVHAEVRLSSTSRIGSHWDFTATTDNSIEEEIINNRLWGKFFSRLQI